MDLDVGGVHTVAAYVAVLLGVLGPVLGIVYAFRVEQRDFWRRPMMAGATFTFLGVAGAYLSGRRLVSEHPRLLNDPEVMPHLAYADRLLIPVAGFFVMALLTGLINPRTGALRAVLPLLLTAFAAIVLALVALSSESGARQLLDQLLGQF